MVIFRLRRFTRGFAILILLFVLNFASADSFTGAAQPLSVEYSQCSVPPPDIADGTFSAQAVSQFTYWACREYRSSKVRTIYYRIEMVTDGEYVHLIPVPGQNAIDPMDYRYTTASVFQSCQKIRDLTIATSVPVDGSKCSGQ